LANGLWVELYGEPSNVALYNMACCLSIAADNVDHGGRGVLDGILGPVANAEGYLQKSRQDLALDAAVKYLRMACATGYLNFEHMSADPDLVRLRSSRHQQFNLIYQQFIANAAPPQTQPAPPPAAFSFSAPSVSMGTGGPAPGGTFGAPAGAAPGGSFA